MGVWLWCEVAGWAGDPGRVLSTCRDSAVSEPQKTTDSASMFNGWMKRHTKIELEGSRNSSGCCSLGVLSFQTQY